MLNSSPQRRKASVSDPNTNAAREWRRFIRRLRHHMNLVVGGLILLFYLLVAVFAPLLAPYGPNEQNLLLTLAPPSSEHLFGTDHIGRDILSRVLIGTRYSLLISLLSVVLGALIGIPLGMIAGYWGGRVDSILTSGIDVVLTIPVIVLAIAIVSIIGPGLFGLIIAISLSYAPRVARITRGAVLDIRQEEYVSSSLALGAGTPRVLTRHILPNAAAPLIIDLTLLAGQAVLVAAALGFLGLGVQPPLPEWGTMLSRGKDFLAIAPHIVTAPGLAIAFLVLGFNFFGDGLRDIWDPKLTR